MSNLLPLINYDRLRMETDGEGVTTLVASMGCPLSCRYCINKPILTRNDLVRNVTPEELLEMVRIDDLYFQATGGGIVFGGGEPLLHAAFIRDFAEIMPKEWKLILETSLNVPEENLRLIMPYVDYYIADIKETDPETYLAYTGISGERPSISSPIPAAPRSPWRRAARTPATWTPRAASSTGRTGTWRSTTI